MVFFNDRVISFEKFKANQDFIIIHTLKKFPRTSDIFNQSLKVKSNQIFFFKSTNQTLEDFLGLLSFFTDPVNNLS